MALLSRTSPARSAPLAATGYTSIVVAALPGPDAAQAVNLACELAAEKGATIAVVSVVEIPELLPLDARMDAEEDAVHDLFLAAHALADAYGVRVRTHLARGREAGPLVVDEVRRRNAQLVLVGYATRERSRPGRTAEHVLRHAPSRVLLVRSV